MRACASASVCVRMCLSVSICAGVCVWLFRICKNNSLFIYFFRRWSCALFSQACVQGHRQRALNTVRPSEWVERKKMKATKTTAKKKIRKFANVTGVHDECDWGRQIQRECEKEKKSQIQMAAATAAAVAATMAIANATTIQLYCRFLAVEVLTRYAQKFRLAIATGPTTEKRWAKWAKTQQQRTNHSKIQKKTTRPIWAIDRFNANQTK